MDIKAGIYIYLFKNTILIVILRSQNNMSKQK